MRYTLLSGLFLAASLAVLTSYSSGVSNQFDLTGSPLANRVCATCHNGGSFATETSIKLFDANGTQQTNYVAGELYTVEISYTATGTPSAFGFQAVILDNANMQAGQLGTAPAGTRIRKRGNIDYIDHSQRLTGNSVSVDWTAPAQGTGDVNLYAVVNAINGNGGTTGDTPDEGSLTITELAPPPTIVYHPRNLEDLRGVNAAGIADSLGITIEVEGIVYGFDTEPDVSNFNILNADGTAGLAVLNYSDSLHYTANEGDLVVLRGELKQVVGLTYIEAVEVEVLAQGQSLPQPISTEQLDESFEGRFVNLDGLTVIDTSNWEASPTSTFDFPFLTRAGDTVIAQIAMGMPIWGEAFPGGGFDEYLVSGVVRQFDQDAPLLEGYYILPRSGVDFLFLLNNREVKDFELSVTRFGESLNVEAPSAIANVKVVGLNGQILQHNVFGNGLQQVSFSAPFGKTPLQAVWVQLEDGRRKAVFVR